MEILSYSSVWTFVFGPKESQFDYSYEGYSRKKYLWREEGKRYIFLSVVGADIFSNYMSHWCLKKSDYMGGGVIGKPVTDVW